MDWDWKASAKRFVWYMVIAVLAQIWTGASWTRPIRNVVASIPFEVYVGLVAVPVIWVALDTEFDDDSRVPEVPFLVFVGSLLGVIVLTTHWVVSQPLWFRGLGIEYLFGILAGALVWFVTQIAIIGIIISIRGEDLDKRRMERRMKNTDDPYGDKHASKVLDDN